MSYADEVLADGPWGFWPTTETSGAALADASGGGRPLTITGSPTLAQVGPDGSTLDAVDWPTTASTYASTAATVSTSAATAEVWVYVRAYPVGGSVGLVACAASYGSTTTDKALAIRANGRVVWHVYDGATQAITSSDPIPLNTWCHVVASVGAAGAKLRVNKTQVASGAAVSSFSGAMRVFVRGGGNATGGTEYDYTLPGAVVTSKPALYTTQLPDARTDAHYDAMFGAAPTVIPGEAFTSAATALDGVPVLPISVAGEPFTSAATALDGTADMPPPVLVAGEPFTSAATALDGVIADLPVGTDTSNALGGRSRGGFATVTLTVPVAAVPADAPHRVDKALAYPTPTLVDGRPQ